MNSADFVEQIRGFLDEDNTESIKDKDILQAVNRAVRKAANIAARKYDPLFWKSVTLETIGGQSQYAIPKEAYGRRIEMVEVRQQGVSRKITRIDNQDRTRYISRATQTSLPVYYSLQKDKLEFYPVPTGQLIMDIHYNQKPEDLVPIQGRVTNLDRDNNTILVDAVGDDVNTEIGNYGAFINFVDFTTGAIKGTMQVALMDKDNGLITFKSSGLDRDRVLLKTVQTELPDNLEEDDLICLVNGTCVSEIPEAYANFIIQHAVVSLKRRLGEDVGYELADLRESQEEIDKMFVGRESSKRVSKKGSHFSGPIRRYIT